MPALPRVRSRRRPVIWVLVGALLLANVAVFFTYWTLRQVETTFSEDVVQVPEVVPELSVRPTQKSEPVTFLVIGSDSREGLDDLTNFGYFEGARGDVIILIKLYPETGTAQMLSLPRDLWVEIPGHGSNRINAAYAFGGAPLMVRTVRQVTGLPIHHYVEVDFVGFKSIVNQLGGVTVNFPYPARDRKSGLLVDAGDQRLNGTQALAYARSREYQENRNGGWTTVDGGDIGRTHRQQQLIFAILEAVARPSNLIEAGQVVESFAKHLTIDAALAHSSVVELAFRMRNIRPTRIDTATIPGTGKNVNGASVLEIQEPEASHLFTAFGNGTPFDPTTAQVLRLEVLNGNGVKGSAGIWSEQLRAKGFEVTRVGDADTADFDTTLVIVRSGELDQGENIIRALGFGRVQAGVVGVGLDAVVIVGADAADSPQSG